MSDELTPEEKAAFERLPRERMPAGLEPRVMEAMREHGFLAPRRRALVLTRGRAAGLVAAAFAMVIGAYAIGFERGRPDALVPAATTGLETARELPVTTTPAETPPAAEKSTEEKSERATGIGTAAKKDLAPAPAEVRSEPEPEPEPAREAERRVETERAPAAPQSYDALRSPAAAPESASPAAAMRAPRASGAPAPQMLEIILDGKRMTVQADSIRTVEDDRGRALLIFTPDGVIRLPVRAR